MSTSREGKKPRQRTELARVKNTSSNGGDSQKPSAVQEFLRKSTPYPRWRGPIDPRLRQAVLMSGVTIPVAMIITLWAPAGVVFGLTSGFFWILPGFFTAWMSMLAGARPVVITIALVSAGVGYVLWERTNGLRAGNRFWQRMATILALLGALGVLASGVPLLILALNLMVWLLAILLVILIALAVLGALAS